MEDEQPARELLQGYINKTPFIDCIGVYENGLDIPQEKLLETNLLFLDIELPELNGLSYLKTIENNTTRVNDMYNSFFIIVALFLLY